ncbi:hypothetical protein [Clostridioides sp. ZZV15-6598]|uniref:hypothetical protein n=1 Tax=Clostridioides sp. ZZV15-6598 TaxID=2811501 RepID=UPI001D124578|nr:hypothetical protein [Clostridioides sp. ZZV15-6598]
MKVKINSSLIVFGTSILTILYFFVIVSPFIEMYGLLSENTIQSKATKISYFCLTTPVFIAYAGVILCYFRRITFFKCINYPLIVTNVYFGTFACLMVFGGSVLWLMVATFFFFILSFFGSFFVGIFKDIHYFRRWRLSK